jgi:hypothetical protein
LSFIPYRIGAAKLTSVFVAVNAETLATRAALFTKRLNRTQHFKLFDLHKTHIQLSPQFSVPSLGSFLGDN